ncbi:helix-turn-helix domain-containing protein [Microbacterium halotolerans]|uniref:helix-turn-helix domain-containing protein n=1 Tax=Microbacterium halotolerans TaxID=246613 RepID=UPI000E6AD570|nr:XRE family transcriptional regulator [Microbacterium halotolerans]
MEELTSAELGARIRDARDRRGLNQSELGARVQMDRTVVNKIEAGIRKVSALELSQFAEALGVRMASFFTDPVPAIVSHRSSQGTDVVDSQIDALLDQLVVDVELVQDLGGLDRRDAPDALMEMPTSYAEAESMAQRARKIVDLDNDTHANDLQRLFEAAGLLVFSRDLGTDTADAGTVLLRDGTGVSIVNSTQKVGRRRLAAAHEFGHFLVADEYSIDWRVTGNDLQQTEALLDRFARAFLLPEKGLRAVWESRMSADDLRAAAVVTASTFRVDMATLARRLTELDLVTGAQAGQIRGVRTTRTDIIEHDLHAHDDMTGTTQPPVFQKAVLQLVRRELISEARALDLLWGTVGEDELPEPHIPENVDLWQYAS